MFDQHILRSEPFSMLNTRKKLMNRVILYGEHKENTDINNHNLTASENRTVTAHLVCVCLG